MTVKIGIRREDKSIWERRVPIIPDHVRKIIDKHNIEFIIQPSDTRIFKDNEYKKAGAKIKEDLSSCDVVFAVKEIPEDFFRPGKVYIFFSHTIKGQEHNMPMLKMLIQLRCTLIDYEKITDKRARRIVFFGSHAGLAGMVDALWAFGRRCEWEGVKTPFLKIDLAHKYAGLDEIMERVGEVGDEIAQNGLPKSVTPFVCGFAGYGNVSQGAQEIFDLLPVKEISPSELTLDSRFRGNDEKLAKKCHSCESRNLVYKVVFKEEDMVEPKDVSATFKLQDYYQHPEKYRGVFEKYVPHLGILMNCIYWDTRYPRLITKKSLKKLYSKKRKPRLKVVGDISCDVDGAIEATVKCTDSGNPVFVYDVGKDAAVDGWEGRGPVILAVDNLPCEIASESSIDFSSGLGPFIPSIAKADYSVSFEQLDLPTEIKDAVIVYRGELTPDYKYLEDNL